VFLTGFSRTPVHGMSVEVMGDLGKGTDRKEAKKRRKEMEKPV